MLEIKFRHSRSGLDSDVGINPGGLLATEAFIANPLAHNVGTNIFIYC